jgi:hypothetical protein
LAWERALIAEEERARNLRRPGPFLLLLLLLLLLL